MDVARLTARDALGVRPGAGASTGRQSGTSATGRSAASSCSTALASCAQENKGSHESITRAHLGALANAPQQVELNVTARSRPSSGSWHYLLHTCGGAYCCQPGILVRHAAAAQRCPGPLRQWRCESNSFSLCEEPPTGKHTP